MWKPSDHDVPGLPCRVVGNVLRLGMILLLFAQIGKQAPNIEVRGTMKTETTQRLREVPSFWTPPH